MRAALRERQHCAVHGDPPWSLRAKRRTSRSRLGCCHLRQGVPGRAVPQDPNDEPASVLLERIRAEREKAEHAESAGRPKRRRETQIA